MFEKRFSREGSIYATIKYLIDHKIYSLEQNLTKDNLKNPKLNLKDAHLVIGLEPYETFANLKYYSEKTVIILNVHSFDSKFTQLALKKKIGVPPIGCIVDILDQLVRRIIALDIYELATSVFQTEEYVPMIILGLATKEFKEILNKKKMIESINKETPRGPKLVEAFQYGFDLIEY